VSFWTQFAEDFWGESNRLSSRSLAPSLICARKKGNDDSPLLSIGRNNEASGECQVDSNDYVSRFPKTVYHNAKMSPGTEQARGMTLLMYSQTVRRLLQWYSNASLEIAVQVPKACPPASLESTQKMVGWLSLI
jgi:hypothetical protein